MPAPNTPTNFYAQTANRQNYLSWDLTPTATSYTVQRSIDGVTYSTVATPSSPNYLDTSVTIGTLYYYQVNAVNLSGSSAYTTPQTLVPVPTGEMSLGEIRTRSQQKADRINSNFVTVPEWNAFINLALFELYDLLITVYEDYFLAAPAQFTANGTSYQYPLPDGSLTFFNPITKTSAVAQPFYKLMGVDLALNNANNANVTVNKFQFAKRNQFVYPNSSSTIYGIFNIMYRVLGNTIELIPTPAGNQLITLWYIPRLVELLADTDITTIGYSGWLHYVIVRAAKYALDKEEADTTKLENELIFLKQRIEETAANRDSGMPDKITDNRGNGGYWGTGTEGIGWGGSIGGW